MTGINPDEFVNTTITKNFESGVYSLKRVPRVLEIDYTGAVYVHKDGPHQNEIKSLENMDWEGDRCLTPKLRGDSYGEFTFLIGIINAKYFVTREKLDALYSKGYEHDSAITTVERIPFEAALKLMKVDISCNMEYYLRNREEMEKDLGHTLEESDVINEEMMKGLEAELFYNQAVNIFGDASDDDVTKGVQGVDRRSLSLREFRLLYSDGNTKIATARRESHYVLLFFITG